MDIFGEYIDYLQRLSKEKLQLIVDDYNKLANIYNFASINTKKMKKEDLIHKIDEIKNEYFKYFIMSLDLNDYNILKYLVNKKTSKEYIEENKSFIDYLVTKNILFLEQELMMARDVWILFKDLLKSTSKYVKNWDKIYKMVDGIIIAYGVVSRKYFEEIISNIEDKELIIPKLEYYYKKEYIIDKRKIMSNKLTNKKKISAYLKDDNYRVFTIKEFEALGNSTYHHSIKCYKRFIKMLKTNYVFRNSDIEFVDLNIIIPYLYNSLNEEVIAKKNLEETVTTLFEFKGDKLKKKILEEIKKIKLEFPLWEYRGYSRGEKNE